MFSEGKIRSIICLLLVILLSIGFSMCFSYGDVSSKEGFVEGLFTANNPTLQQIVAVLKNYNTKDVATCNETISKIKPMLQSSSTQITDKNMTQSISKIIADSSISPLQQMDKIIELNIPTTETALQPLIASNLGTRYAALTSMLQELKQLQDTPAINPNSFSNDSMLTNVLNKAIGSPSVYGGNTSYAQIYNYMQQAYPSLNLTPIPTLATPA